MNVFIRNCSKEKAGERRKGAEGVTYVHKLQTEAGAFPFFFLRRHMGRMRNLANSKKAGKKRGPQRDVDRDKVLAHTRTHTRTNYKVHTNTHTHTL